MDLRLDELTTTSEREPENIIIYGPRGVGKTTFGTSSEMPILIRTERVGHLPASVKMLPMAESFSQVMDYLTLLASEDHGYKSLVVDSLDWLEQLVWQHLIKVRPTDEKGRPVKDITDYGFGKGFQHAIEYWMEYLRAVEFLRAKRGMRIIQIAHAEVRRFDDPTSDSYDRYQIKLHKAAAEKLQEGADAVLFARAKHATTKESVGFNAEKTRAIGQGERVLFTDARPAFDAKNRFGLPFEIPMSMDAGYSVLSRHIDAFYTENNQ
jgi:hypothetical protein